MSNRKRRGRGESSIFQRSDGVWAATVSLGYKPNGKRHRRTVYGSSKQEVQEKLRKLQTDSGTLAPTPGLTVARFLDEWLKVKEGRVEQRTYEQYESHVRCHIKPVIGTILLTKLASTQVEMLLREMDGNGDSAAMRGKVLTTLRTALTYAVDKLKHLTGNPATQVDKPKHDVPEMQALEPDVVVRFLDAAKGDRLYAFFVVAMDTGARPGELFALGWPDVDFEGSAITITKSLMHGNKDIRIKSAKTKKSRRRIPLSSFAIEALAEHRKNMMAEGNLSPDKPVFCDCEGGYLRRWNVWARHFTPIRKNAGIPHFRLYDVRHSMASLLLLAGENPKVVSERLGHSTTRLTMDTYSHVLPGLQERAAGKMDAIFRHRPEAASKAIG